MLHFLPLSLCSSHGSKLGPLWSFTPVGPSVCLESFPTLSYVTWKHQIHLDSQPLVFLYALPHSSNLKAMALHAISMTPKCVSSLDSPMSSSHTCSTCVGSGHLVFLTIKREHLTCSCHPSSTLPGSITNHSGGLWLLSD